VGGTRPASARDAFAPGDNAQNARLRTGHRRSQKVRAAAPIADIACRTTAELPPSVTSACLAFVGAQNRYDDVIDDFPV